MNPPLKWPTVKLRDISEGAQYGFTASASPDVQGPKFLRITDIVPDNLDWQSVPRCEIKSRDLERFKLADGDIVVARTGATVGYAKLIKSPPDAVFASYLVRFRVTKDVCAGFVGAIVQSQPYKDWVKSQAGGSAQPNANAQTLGQFELPLPPLATQRRIASILGAYDDLIEVNRRRIAVLEEMARGLFEEWFVRFRFPGHEAVPILDTPNGPLPEGWTWGAFRDLVREVRQTVSPDDVPPDTPYVGLEHMPRRSFTLDQHGQAEEVSSLKSRFQRGDILFGKIRPYFHKVVWAGFDGVSSTDAIVWRPISGLAAQAIATASSDAFVAYSVQTSNGTKMPRANTRVLADYRCALAPSDISRRFEDTVGPMVELCATLQAESRRLAASRDLLLPRLISGQLSVTEAERELEEAA